MDWGGGQTGLCQAVYILQILSNWNDLARGRAGRTEE